jgi:hypothetical protein
MKKISKIIFINILFMITLLELNSFIFSKLKLMPYTETPQIYRKILNEPASFSEMFTHDKIWGAWRKKNFTSRQVKSCFDVIHKTNEIGARDNSFDTKYKKNFIMLGDSFAEGYGVKKSKTLDTLLENKNKVNIFNFGGDMSFGPLQYYLIYENLAKNYDHDAVILIFLPQNDFVDNDYNWFYWKNYPYKRPYYKKINNEYYDFFIPKVKNKKFGQKVKESLDKYFWLSNLYKTIKFFSNKETNLYEILEKGEQSFESEYFESDIENQYAALHFIKKIFYSQKKIFYFVIAPATKDILKKKLYKMDNPFWVEEIIKLSKIEKNFILINLMDYLPTNPKKLFLECDGHWSEYGNLWASEIISGYIK